MDIQQMLTYSQGIVGDWAQKNPIADWIAPNVAVTAPKFQYKNYGSGNAFLQIDTRRSMGGSAPMLTYTVSDTWGVVVDNYIGTSIDDMERRQNPESEGVLESIKIRDVTLTALNTDLKSLFTFMKASVGVTGGVGVWDNTATNDPIAEIDGQVKAIADATGVVCNRMFIDLTAWLLLKNNKSVLDRIRYTKLGMATTETISMLLAVPMDIRIGGGALYTDVGGSANNVFIFYGQDSPGQQDPSWIKTFVRNPNRFSKIETFRDAPHFSDVYVLEWEQLRVVTGAGIVSRIQVT